MDQARRVSLSSSDGQARRSPADGVAPLAAALDTIWPLGPDASVARHPLYGMWRLWKAEGQPPRAPLSEVCEETGEFVPELDFWIADRCLVLSILQRNLLGYAIRFEPMIDATGTHRFMTRLRDWPTHRIALVDLEVRGGRARVLEIDGPAVVPGQYVKCLDDP